MAIRVKLSNQVLKDHNPFRRPIWYGCETPIRKLEVTKAIIEKRFNRIPYRSPYSTNNKYFSRQEHIERIAWLVVHPHSRPIKMDVDNLPRDGYIEDGYHRLAAAYYRGDKTILADISGDCEYAEEVLELPKGSMTKK
jgi:hypothetical protein